VPLCARDFAGRVVASSQGRRAIVVLGSMASCDADSVVEADGSQKFTAAIGPCNTFVDRIPCAGSGGGCAGKRRIARSDRSCRRPHFGSSIRTRGFSARHYPGDGDRGGYRLTCRASHFAASRPRCWSPVACGTSARALARCLANVACRLANDDPVNPLSPADEAQLLNWDAEKYRRSLDQRAP
jgi:hypothetical protein